MTWSIELEGKFFRDVDRLMGRIPALDAAIRKRLPAARNEIGMVISSRAKRDAPRRTGALASAIGFETKNDALSVGVWDVPYAYPTEFGSPGGNASPMIVNRHSRMQTTVFGERVAPFEVEVGQFVRRTKVKRQQFLFPSYYASFGAMFGILNKVIEECKEETGLGRN